MAPTKAGPAALTAQLDLALFITNRLDMSGIPDCGRLRQVFLSSQLRDRGGVVLPRTPQSATAHLGRFGL
jgi:hypothetical protein